MPPGEKDAVEYYDEYDRLLYDEEEEPVETGMEEIVSMCSRHEIGLFLVSLAKTIVEALNTGVKIIIDVEPIQYESAISLLSHAVYCSKFWRNVLTLKDRMANRHIFINFSMYVPAKSSRYDINVIIDRERKKDELMEKIDIVLSKSRQLYFYVASKPPEITFTSALYKRNLILEAIRKTLTILDMKYGKETKDYREKLKYVGRVPHELCLLMPADIVKSVAKQWVPPPPANSDYLREKYRPLDSLILPKEFKEILKQYIEVLRAEGRGSLMLIGLPGSGRKTIARSIAGALDLPAYSISIANILSRYVGESEGRLKAFFDSLRARGGLAVFESIEALFRKSSENVTPNLRSILFQQMAREDNNFIIVFTTNQEAPPQVFDSPLIGEVKMVVPLPNKEERRRLTRLFLKEIVGDKWDKMIGVVKKTINKNDDVEAENVLYSLYADVFVEPTIGFTPGEIYQVMRIILRPVPLIVTKKERLIGIADMVLKYTKRDLSARQAKIRQLIDISISLGWFDVAKILEDLNNELTRVALEKEKKK